ncbi:MAG: signal peptidase II [Firmicutes bacterium]|nr:signal peptidase II [Bacillota bacterium]
MHLVLAILLLIIDQASKFWVQRTLPMNKPHAILPPLLYLTYVENPGAAFSLLPGWRWFFIVVALAFLILVRTHLVQMTRENPSSRWGLALALAGTAGNLIDRIRHGSVIDFLDVPFFTVFNIADCCIVIGFGLIIWNQFHSHP